MTEGPKIHVTDEQPVEELPPQYTDLIEGIKSGVSDILDRQTFQKNDEETRTYTHGLIMEYLKQEYFKTTLIKGYQVICDRSNNPIDQVGRTCGVVVRVNLLFKDGFGIYLDCKMERKVVPGVVVPQKPEIETLEHEEEETDGTLF